MTIHASLSGSSTQAGRLCWLTLFLWLFLILSVGCNRNSQLDSTWAAHEYPKKTASVNGLGYFEKLCQQRGAHFKSVSRLSPRLDRVDCLILIGNTLHPPAKEARDWLEEWLAAKSGRRVIYFGRDFDAAEFYMQETLDEQPPERRMRASLDLASARVKRDDLLYEQMDRDYFCRWFYTRVSQPQRSLEKFSGPWSEQLNGDLKWPVRAYLDVPDQALRDEDQPDWSATPKATPKATTSPRFPNRRPGTPPTVPKPKAVPRPPTTPTTPTPPPQSMTPDENRTVFTSFWNPEDIGNADDWEREWDLAPDAEQLLIGDDGTPLIMRLTSDHYPGSHILTLANGAALFNGMMVDANMRRLCKRIADEIGQDARVAYLPYDAAGIQVSRVPDSDDEVAGLSVLMTWPLNILMAHLAFLGVLICIALFPILGRPQKLKHANVSDFGQHAEAMGQLLLRSRDLPMALKLVGDYLRIVRGEALPTWIESEIVKHTPQDAQSPATTPSPLAANAPPHSPPDTLVPDSQPPT